ncbi:hypothetical protein DBR40_07280 [Pedobacter sp. KBW01]|uniref:ABC-three component system protein n=1 Tax=Pedobacter sp. KBW01 TaxID=2153364 RepID=UPI000F5AFA0E|nr:ABC-three component system protein [Pedobacter sp. KBW01]RQO77770.1 hypothetical protein DBR40_07280 [Pedobacter sp. KBW01]
MGTNAPGQLLGFSLQFPRALWHLLTSGPGDKISLEVLGDVGVAKEDQSKLAEEDKSSQNGNPVTDLSSDLWKTFYNWTNQVISGELDPANTVFMLYANKKGRKGIVDSFNRAITKTDADAAIQTALLKVKKIDSKHEIFKHVDFLSKHTSELSSVVEKFEFVTGSGTGLKEVEKAILTKHVGVNQVDYLKQRLLGWLFEDVMAKLAVKQQAVITWEEFDKNATKFLESARKRELIDFALEFPPNEEDTKKQKLQRPLYIQQLEAIDSDDDEIQDAVTAFLRAKVNRQMWIENELIDEDVALDFEGKLMSFWRNSEKEVRITHSALPDVSKGQLVYLACMKRQLLIKNQEPPIYTIAGSYHLMSNGLSLGWHPNWKTSFKPLNKAEDE